MQKEIIQVIVFSVPAMCALSCMIILCIDVFHPGKNRKERQLRLFLMLTYSVAMLCWTGLILQVAFHRAFVHYHPIFFFTLMMDQVLIYRFVHLITAVRGGDRFNFLHIAVPVILATLLVASVPLIPSETRLEILYNADGNFDNPLYSVLNKISGIVFIVYNILYPVLGLARIRRYRYAIVNYSADTQRTSLNWLTILQILTLLTIPVPLAGMLLNMAVFSNFWTSIQGVLPTFFVYPLLCYNLLSDNYEIMTSTGDESLPLPDQITGDESFSGKSSAIDPKRFDKYLKDKQPYLNPKIHITDFASALQTNTKYVSACINNRYKMNFSSFINSLRLEELERLRKSTQMQSHDNMDIILMSGFSNYRSYLRAKKTQDRAKLLKV